MSEKKENKQEKLSTELVKVANFFAIKGFGPIFNLVMIVIIVFAIALVDKSTLFITIPFLFIPYNYATLTSVLLLDKDTDTSYFKKSLSYFRGKYSGMFRLIRNFFVSGLFALAVSFVVCEIYYSIMVSQNPLLPETMQKFTSMAISGDRESVMELLTSNPDIKQFLNVFICTETFSFFISFAHQIAFHGTNIFLRQFSSGPSPIKNRLFKETIKDNNPDFRRFYWKIMWPLLIVEIVGLAFGYWVGQYMPFDIYRRSIFAVGFSTTLITMCYSYYVSCLANIFHRFNIRFLKSYAINQFKLGKALMSEDDDPDVQEAIKKDMDNTSRIIEEQSNENEKERNERIEKIKNDIHKIHHPKQEKDKINTENKPESDHIEINNSKSKKDDEDKNEE